MIYFTIVLGLKKKKEAFESELDGLGSLREMQLRESEASGRISGLEKKIQYAEIEKVLQCYNMYLFLTPSYGMLLSSLII